MREDQIIEEIKKGNEKALIEFIHTYGPWMKGKGVLFDNVIHYDSINGVRQDVNFWPISMENLTEDGRMTLTTSEIIFNKPLPEYPFDLTIEFEDKKGSYDELHTYQSR